MRTPWKSGTAWLAAAVIALGIGAAGVSRAAEDDGRAWIGIYMQTLDEGLRDAYGQDGVLVNRVSSDSPAKTAGIQRGDLITRIDGKVVSDSDELSDAIESHKVGEKVSITLLRAGRERTLMVTLAERPDDLDDMATPYPPRAPRAPRAPMAPRMFWGNDFNHLMSLDNRGRLGVRVETLSDELGEALEVPGGKGVLVLQVMEETPAQEAGMKAGDVIVRVGTRTIDDHDDLTRALRSSSGKVEIEVVRKGASKVVTPTLPTLKSRSYSWSGDSEPRVKIKTLEGDDENAELRRELEQLRRELEELKEDRGDK
jgi:serine protease Do